MIYSVLALILSLYSSLLLMRKLLVARGKTSILMYSSVHEQKNQLFSPDGFTDYEMEWSTTPTEVQFDLYLQVERRGKIVLAGK